MHALQDSVIRGSVLLMDPGMRANHADPRRYIVSMKNNVSPSFNTPFNTPFKPGHHGLIALTHGDSLI